MTEQSGARVIALDLTLRELNPNHKYRMALMGVPPFHWLAELGVVRRDESLYLMPLIQREYTLDAVGPAGLRGQWQVFPKTGLHISFHHSGRVNLELGHQRVQYREANATAAALGPLFAVVVNSTQGLREATVDEINTSPAKRRVMPLLGGWFHGPVGITVYRTAAGVAWTAPVLADAAQVNVYLPVRDKAVQYHVVVWQHRGFKAPPGDLALYIPKE